MDVSVNRTVSVTVRLTGVEAGHLIKLCARDIDTEQSDMVPEYRDTVQAFYGLLVNRLSSQ